MKTPGKKEKNDLGRLNKQLLQSLYPDDIAATREILRLNTPYTLMVQAAKNITKIPAPKVLPVKVVGYVDLMPLYSHHSYMDISVLQRYLELTPAECTCYVIRLKDRSLTGEVKKSLEKYVADRGLNYRVVDYKFMGKEQMTIIIAFSVVLLVVVGLFIVTMVFFIINMVMLSILKRRREIGTSIALGMSNLEIMFVLLGEVFVILTISWVVGSVLGASLMLLFGKVGIPGMVFFQKNTLYLLFSMKHIFVSYLIVMPPALVAAMLSLLRVRRLKPVDLLKEGK